ncbi:MAG: hypothetical protein GX291_03705 [Tissierellia bacterium]|nr:hypothetical protein [Tissierellia bacterium]
MDILMAVVFILLAMSLGDIVSTKTKAFVPSVFVTAALFVIGYWTFWPNDIVSIASWAQPAAGLAMYMLITHMGSLMNLRELAAQWKTVLIALAGLAGIMAILLTVGRLVLGYETVVAGAPPLTGGVVAALVMQAAAEAKGMTELAVLAILVFVAQGFVGYPITAVLLKKEGQRLLAEYRSGKAQVPVGDAAAAAAVVEKKPLIPPVPEKYNTTYLILLKLAVVSVLADRFAKLVNAGLASIGTDVTLHPLVVCLVFGVIFTQIGFLDRNALNKANSFGWLMTVLMAFVFDGLRQASPAMLLQVAGSLVGVIGIGVIGLLIFAFIAAKILKESVPMALCIALNALYGFPPNFILTNDAVKALTDDPVEAEYLTGIMMPKMLVGGFTTVTIASVIIGGIFATLL